MSENNLNFASMANGGVGDQVNLERKRQKATGDVKDEQPDQKGLAKASPKFQEIPKENEQDEQAKARALAEKTIKIPEK